MENDLHKTENSELQVKFPFWQMNIAQKSNKEQKAQTLTALRFNNFFIRTYYLLSVLQIKQIFIATVQIEHMEPLIPS